MRPGTALGIRYTTRRPSRCSSAPIIWRRRATLLAAATVPQTFTGAITGTMCGANHKGMGIAPGAKCVRDCVKSDTSAKYPLLVRSNVYVLSDQKTPDKFAAQKVKVTGTLGAETKTLKADRIEPAN